MSTHSWTPAPVWEAALSSAIAGERGHSRSVGAWTDGTSPGQRPWAWNSSSGSFSSRPPGDPNSRSTATTEESSKVGGLGVAGTLRRTKSSNASTPFSAFMAALSTQDTYLAQRIQRTVPPEESSPATVSSFPRSTSRRNSIPSSFRSTTRSTDSIGYALFHEALTQVRNPGAVAPLQGKDDERLRTSSPRRGNSSNPRARGSIFRMGGRSEPPKPPARTPPLPYPANLTPIPSPLRPHCAASERIKRWLPANARKATDSLGRPTTLNQQDLERIESVSLSSFQPATQATYGSGLLAFHVFCDQKNIPEEQRAPVDILILQSFVATLAGIYSAPTITNYVAAVRAWHIVHGIPWNINSPEVNATIKGAKAMAPTSSTKAKRDPMTVAYIEGLRLRLSDQAPLDVAVFACLTSAFWSTARLGELMVRTLLSFNPQIHVKRSDLGRRVDRSGLETTTIHVPQTKSSPIEGEDLYWARQNGASDPESALQRHLALNNPPAGFH